MSRQDDASHHTHQLAVTIRPMEPRDATAVAALSGELGYPASTAQCLERLERIRASALTQPAEVLVAVAPGPDVVVGWVHACVPADLVKDRVADIWGLVVDSTHTGRGVGRALMAAAETWAAARGCGEMRLRSGSHRQGAHAFYQRLGYRFSKGQVVFSRSLDG